MPLAFSPPDFDSTSIFGSIAHTLDLPSWSMLTPLSCPLGDSLIMVFT
eukprot:CAMPEP_0118633410 /NCGR_PEP_ID=MMETSP0785-20121206/982_1 /TAXON_ID=91992 /ORGANISM="Bolidomonas pacifica, Strain CCMP 1866" /LENGTH=47 /DNA_ID= /DNA_START= /DNA_END= /DNA_ORIENTATION=